MSGHIIEVSQLVRRFGSFLAVNDVSFHVERGEIFGYLGANGAGKSTTIRMLCGLLAPTGGEALVAGHSIRTPERVKSSIGYMSQKFSLYMDLAVEHNLAFFGGAYGLSGKALSRRIDEILELVNLKERRRDITGTLSGGFRQRLALGSALIHQPQVVFLDEPTAGVDPASRRDFWRLIRSLARNGTTIFVTTHYMDEAEYCARVGLMVSGRLVALDTPKGLKQQFVPGTIFAVSGRLPRMSALEELRQQPGVLAVESFGAGLHVRVETGRMEAAALTATLERCGGQELLVKPVEATLEDVFLKVVAPSAPPATGAAKAEVSG
jgi:ABC-2 type transport system ATP-binding protein